MFLKSFDTCTAMADYSVAIRLQVLLIGLNCIMGDQDVSSHLNILVCFDITLPLSTESYKKILPIRLAELWDPILYSLLIISNFPLLVLFQNSRRPVKTHTLFIISGKQFYLWIRSFYKIPICYSWWCYKFYHCFAGKRLPYC